MPAIRAASTARGVKVNEPSRSADPGRCVCLADGSHDSKAGRRGMSLHRIFAMMRKEIIQILRDPLSLLIIF